MSSPHKYGVLRAIAVILKVLAWLALAVGLLVGIIAAFSGGGGAAAPLLAILRSLGLVAGPLVGILWFIQLYALGSVLSLLIDIEENTRAIALPGDTTAPIDLA